MARNEINRMSVKFDSRSNNEAFARQTIAAFASQLDPTLEELNDIKTAVSEAVTNCIVHAYRQESGWITMAAVLYDNGDIRIQIKDKGCGIADVKRRASRCLQPVIRSGPGWDLRLWRTSWTASASAPARGSAHR